jgi:hypothetical protein
MPDPVPVTARSAEDIVNEVENLSSSEEDEPTTTPEPIKLVLDESPS